MMKSEQVMLSKSASVGTSYSITAGDELSITVGEASLVMKSDGTIQINGKKIESVGSDSINFTSPSINNN
jgi:type VI secretion system secreted protein VgrG